MSTLRYLNPFCEVGVSFCPKIQHIGRLLDGKSQESTKLSLTTAGFIMYTTTSSFFTGVLRLGIRSLYLQDSDLLTELPPQSLTYVFL